MSYTSFRGIITVDPKTGKGYTSFGGLLIKSLPVPPKTYTYVASGGILFGGAAATFVVKIVSVYNYVASGGIQLGGAADTSIFKALASFEYGVTITNSVEYLSKTSSTSFESRTNSTELLTKR